MNRLIKQFSFLILVLLTISCSAHRNSAYNHHIPPAQPGSQVQNADVYQSLRTEELNLRKQIVQNAIKSLGISYKWGGRSFKTGFDCSGQRQANHLWTSEQSLF
jgi:cell wall-associated NlpC family hydrolase